MRAHVTPRLAELGFAADPATTPATPPRIAPTSIQQAADLLGECSRQGWRVRLAGAGSRGLPAPAADLVVSSRALVGLDIYEPDDLTVGVRAGTTHHELDTTLAAHRQLLPLDPPGGAGATLGGTFAAAAAGPLLAAYGTPRDFALGIHAVTADGRVLRLGGQVVKNVAGYDLVRLLVGSRGTLALIAQVHVRLRSLPAADATLIVPVRDAAEAAALALEVRDTLHPVALEVLGPHGPQPWRLALRFHGSTAVMDDVEGKVRQRVADTVRLAPEAAATLWAALRHAEGTAGTRIRLQARPTELPRLLALAGRIVAAEGAAGGEWLQLAHGGDGIVRLIHPGREPGGQARLEALLPAIVEDVAKIDGTCICETGPDALREAARPPEPASAVARLQLELRRRFDPAAILFGD